MENKNSITNATFVNPTSIRVSKDGRYLIIALPGNQVPPTQATQLLSRDPQ